MNIILPDGSTLSVPEGATALTVAQTLGSRLAKAALAAKVNGKVVDLSAGLSDGDQVAIVTSGSEEGLSVLRHSASHVLAEAVTRVRPGTKVAIGPSIKDGFYYDFEFAEPVCEEDLARFQEEVEKSLKAGKAFRAPGSDAGRGAGDVLRRTLQGRAHP